jgi:mRNA interferase RelE/StbE
VSQSREVRISARAERDIARLPEKIAAACVEFIFGPLAEYPSRVGTELRGGQFAGLRSARRGSYRIIYKVDDEQDRIDIVHIDHRGDVYR